MGEFNIKNHSYLIKKLVGNFFIRNKKFKQMNIFQAIFLSYKILDQPLSVWDKIINLNLINQK